MARFVVPIALGLPLAMFVSGCGHSGLSSTAVRGSVPTTVAATGSLRVITESTVRNLSFPASGRLTELDVSVGDRVTVGQILAKTDNTEQQVVLRKDKDDVAIQRAILSELEAGNQVSGAVDEVRRYQELLSAAQRTFDQISKAGVAAANHAQRDLDFDRSDLRRQLKQLEIDQRQCDASLQNPVTTGTQTPVINGTQTPCENAESRRDKVADAERRIIDDENSIDTALKVRDVDLATQQANIDGARRDLTVAENKAGLNSSGRPFDITVQKAKLDQAEADVVAAQKALDATVMKSSFSGIVDRINGRVGQVVTPASYSPVSPTAAGRGAGTAGPADSNESAAPQPRGGPFIVLKNVKSFQVMVPFSAADASRMEPGQAVEVTFDAIPGLALKGTLTSIDPTETNSTGDISDLVTVFLTQVDPRLKDGMTAQAHVILGKAENVLIVPSDAVRGSNGRTGTVTRSSLVGEAGPARVLTPGRLHPA